MFCFRFLNHVWVLLVLYSCTPSTPSAPSPTPSTPSSTEMQVLQLPDDQLYDKVFGALLGSAIGDAMGAPTEMWSRHQMQVEFGHIVGLDSMVREPSAEGIWDYNLEAGSTTDDTRWKALMVDFFTGTGKSVQARQAELDANDFARLVMNRYESGIHQLKQTEAYDSEPFENQMRKMLWLKEWAMVAKPFVDNDLAAFSDALNRFYGGEMVCAGMLFSPMVGVLYPGDPLWAYEQTYAIDIYDLGYAKDISGLTASMVAEAMRPGASQDSVLAVMRHVDPKGYFKSRLVGRSAYKLFQDARYLVNEAKSINPTEVLKNPPVQLALPLKTAEDSVRYAQWSTAYQKLDQYLMRFPFHPAEIHLINLTAMMICAFDFERSLEFVINYGRDNDTVGAVTGAILGAYHGAKALPQDQVKQVLEANQKLGFDLEAMAHRMVEAMGG
ncbi:MAG: ADP-ribosylglycohydrolase family protein [Bacteroidota bacterium]